MKSIKCCEHCSYRFVGCHSKCEQYLKEKAEYDQEKKKIDKIKKENKEYESYLDATLTRMRANKHGQK